MGAQLRATLGRVGVVCPSPPTSDMGENREGESVRRSVVNDVWSNMMMASLRRSGKALVASGTRHRSKGDITPSGVVHSLGVLVLEMEVVMSRGKKASVPPSSSNMPKFVDVRLTTEHRLDFSGMGYTDDQLVDWLESFVSDGYRVGFSWANEQQSYIVSLTGRDTGTSNDGYCMTSFAKDVRTAIALAYYKHTVVLGEVWKSFEQEELGDFG